MQLLRSAWLLPIAALPIRDGLVAVSDGRVVWVGRRGDPGQPAGPAPRSRRRACSCPASSTPTATSSSRTWPARRPVGPGGLRPVGRARSCRAAADPRTPRSRRRPTAAIAGLEASGTVAVGDVSNTLAHLDRLAASSLSAVVFLELLAGIPPRRRRRSPGAKACVRDRRRRSRPGLELRLAAHAPHSVSPRAVAPAGREGRSGLDPPGRVARRGAVPGAGDGSLARASWPRAGSATWRSLRRARVPSATPTAWVRCTSDSSRRTACRSTRPIVRCWPSAASTSCSARARTRASVWGRPTCPRSRPRASSLPSGSDSLASAADARRARRRRAAAAAVPRARPRRDPAHGDPRRGRCPGLRGPGRDRTGKRAAFAYAPAPSAPRDPEAFLLSGEARLERVAAAGVAVGSDETRARSRAGLRPDDPLLALGVRAAVRADLGARSRRGKAASPRASSSGSWWRWSRRAAPRWASTASSTTRSTPATRGRRGASCRRASLTRPEAWVFVAVSAAGLVLAAAMLNPLCLMLSPLALAIVLGYSYTKRFTAASHLWSWVCRSRVAPVGAWLAIRGRFERAAAGAGAGGAAVGGRLRHALRLPGRRVRPERRACARCPPALGVAAGARARAR